jgi:hypothetical protein
MYCGSQNSNSDDHSLQRHQSENSSPNDRSLSSLKFNYTLKHTTINCANNLTFPSPLVSLLPWNVNLLTVSATITQTLYNTIHTVCLNLHQSQLRSEQQSDDNHTYEICASKVCYIICFLETCYPVITVHHRGKRKNITKPKTSQYNTRPLHKNKITFKHCLTFFHTNFICKG